jgi:hypothetical protein
MQAPCPVANGLMSDAWIPNFFSIDGVSLTQT